MIRMPSSKYLSRCSIDSIRYLLSMIFVAAVLGISPTQASKSFIPDCSANDRLKCHVEEGSCADNPHSDDYPGAPFDLRISWFMVAATPGKMDSYQLWVNVSWKPTYEKSINKTEGFELTVVDKDTSRQLCWTFKLDQPQWENKDRHTSIRFQFSTIDLFDYGHNYYVEVQSLPKPLTGSTLGRRSNFLGRDVTMPIHPEQFLLEQLNRTGYFESSTSQLEAMTAHCAPSSETSREHGAGAHPQASKWVAAFRYVYIQPKAKFIFVDFVAAPVQYCFEGYELRLLRNMHEIVDHTRIHREDLTHEVYGNVSVAFGNYTFHNVTPGVYEIGVIPIDHSAVDSRCLCPSFGRACTCAQAIWPDVLMPEPPRIPDQPMNPCDQLPPVKLPFDCPVHINGTKGIIVGQGADKDNLNFTSAVVTLTTLLIGALILIVAGVILLRIFYKRHKAKAAARIYLLPMNGTTDFDLKSTTDDSGGPGTEMTPILHRVKVLIIYAQDCPVHVAAVQALGEYLQSQCVCDVIGDYRCANEIDANKFDWAYKSIAEADRVLLVNSYGAYMRYQAKLIADTSGVGKMNDQMQQSSVIVERADPSPYDDLFLLQLDLITQCQQRDPNIGLKFISVRFAYTPAQFILPHANPYIRYEIPRHFRSLTVDLHQLHSQVSDVDDDSFSVSSALPPRLRNVNKRDYDRCAEGDRLKECIEAMKKHIEECPDWFERLHVRRPVVVPVLGVPKTAPSKKLSSPVRTNGYIIAPPAPVSEQWLESLLVPRACESASVPAPTIPDSTADSGYSEPEATTSNSAVCESVHLVSTVDDGAGGYRVPSAEDGLDNDPSDCLLEVGDTCGRSAANLDSCDSGIAADFCSTSIADGSVCNGRAFQYDSPGAGAWSHALKNGTTRIGVHIRSPSNAKKLMEPAALEAQRLLC